MEIKPQKYLPTCLPSGPAKYFDLDMSWGLFFFFSGRTPEKDSGRGLTCPPQNSSQKVSNLWTACKTNLKLQRQGCGSEKVRWAKKIVSWGGYEGEESLKSAFGLKTATAKSFGPVSSSGRKVPLPQKAANRGGRGQQGEKRAWRKTENEFSVLPTFCGLVGVAGGG